MIAPPDTNGSGVARFRAKLLVAMALVVVTITALGLYFAEEKVAVETERDLQRDFEAALASLHGVQEIRHAALAERCRALVGRPRIHAALEDNALDLLYPSAREEMRDVMDEDDAPPDQPAHVLRARFYRFLDGNGAVIPPPNADDVGDLGGDAEAQLTLPRVPERQEIGYLVQQSAGDAIDEVIAMPIVSTETGDVIAAIVLGFKPAQLGKTRAARGMLSGIWLDGALHLPALTDHAKADISADVARALTAARVAESSFRVRVDGAAHQLFFKRLNPGSLFPPACEVCVYPLTELLARQRRLRWQAAGACAVLLLGGIVASHFLATRLARPVEKLAVDSEENRAQRRRAEAALELTSEELQRAARFSADTSHQLKTPVTVLRAGLEELLAHNHLPHETRDEISALIHQTFRLNNIIEDLLLLSRMDAGHLRIDFAPVHLNPLIDAWLDDLSALPDALEVTVETDLPAVLEIAGEKRYTSLILQNLLVNARKYNRPGGRIRITAREDGDWAVLTIGNTGRPIPATAREHIFERFHRAAIGENVPGHGLGLNVARELARLHNGDVRLTRSDDDWTEFEVRFRLASRPPVAVLEVA
ncbi:MAG TPA: HAMP domain-containing sensor histidine kinase [Chthoniobacteraceae bacterium]|nr:HAMP domain-containing sensor histidine kinase [Chthoniobacteraceae bacterium]